MALVTLDDTKNRLGIPLPTITYDVFLQGQIDLMSSTIENYCGRKFNTATYNQTYYATDFKVEKELYLSQYPLSLINSIKEVFSDDSEEVITEYRTQNEKGKLGRLNSQSKTYWFSNSASRIVINYNAGYSTIPLELQEVVYGLIEERYNKEKNGIDINFGNNVQRISIPGTMSIDFDFSLQANERESKFGMILGNYANVLDAFRSERVIIGSIEEEYVN